MYCTKRESKIRKLDVKEKYFIFSPEKYFIFSPQMKLSRVEIVRRGAPSVTYANRGKAYVVNTYPMMLSDILSNHILFTRDDNS